MDNIHNCTHLVTDKVGEHFVIFGQVNLTVNAPSVKLLGLLILFVKPFFNLVGLVDFLFCNHLYIYFFFLYSGPLCKLQSYR